MEVTKKDNKSRAAARWPGEALRSRCMEKMTENLAVLRTMLHLSQAELAQLLGVARSTVAYIETRQRKMTWGTFLALMFVFSQKTETAELLRFLEIFPPELQELYCFDDRTTSGGKRA